MRLYVEQTLGNIWVSPNGLSRFSLATTLGPAQVLELQFGNADPTTGLFIPELLDNPDGMIMGGKQSGIYSGPFATSCSAFTAPGDSSGFYTGVLPTNTAAIQTLLGASNNPDIIPSVLLGCEIDWIPNGQATITKSNPFGLTLNNTYIIGDEGATLPANPNFPPWNQLAPLILAITSLTGGGGTALDGIPTLGSVAPAGLWIPMVRPNAMLWLNLVSPVIATSSVANPSVIATNTPHGFATGQTLTIGGHLGSTPSINGDHVATVIDPTHFSIPVNVTVGGTAGYATAAAVAGSIVRPVDFDPAANARTWQSAA